MTILVSRSAAELDRMELRVDLRANVISLELFETRELIDAPAWEQIVGATIVAIAFTSARAVEPFLDQATLRGITLEGCLIAAVGAATASALNSAGLSVALQGDSGGERFARLLGDELEAGSLVVYPGGRPRRRELGAGLDERSHRVVEIDVYERRIVEPPPSLPTVPIEAVVLSSPRCVGRYLELDGAPLAATHWVLGTSSAAAAADLGLRVRRADSPQLRALLEELCMS